MNALMLAVLLTGQCANGVCLSTEGQVIMGEPVYIDARPVAKAAPAPKYAWIGITEDGLDFDVWGYFDAGGKVVWEPELPENARNFEAAKRAAQAKAKPQPSSTPTPAAPQKEPVQVGAVPNYGIEPGKMKLKEGQIEQYSGSGARRFIEEMRTGQGDQRAQGVQRFHVTIIGTIDDCTRVKNDIATNAAFGGLRDRLLVQDYRPGEWAVDSALGYQTNGKPTILVQQARSAADPNGGRVVFRAMDYSIGPEGLAEAIRKADPTYDPSRDPGPSKPHSPSGGSRKLTADEVSYVIAAVVGLLLIVALPSCKEPQP
jgi:hypothetical protein